MIDRVKWILLALLLFLAAACGGGGGGGGGAAAPPGTVVAGTAAAGIIADGTVRVYGVEPDGSLLFLKEVATDADGAYRADIGAYRGAVAVKAFGSYADEATGSTVSIPEAMALQAAVPASEVQTGVVALSVTPLTDIAVRKALAEGNLAQQIAAANQVISRLFGVDVTATTPVRMDASILQSPGVTQAQKKYTATLAALSQYALNSTGSATPTAAALQDLLSRISSGITATGATPELALNLQQAARDLATNPKTGVLATAASATLSDLATVGNAAGYRVVSYKLRTTGTISGNVFGIQLALGIPSQLSLRSNPATGETASGVVAATGPLSSDAFIAGKVSGGVLTITAIKSTGFPVGEFATVYCEIPAGTTPPSAGAFGPVIGWKAVDPGGAPIAGVGVEVVQGYE